MVAHHSSAFDSIGLVLPECPPAAYRALAELEHSWVTSARPRAVSSTLRRLDAAVRPTWTDQSEAALHSGSSLTVFSDFPLGLSRPFGLTAPLSCAMPVSYRPLTPLTRTLPNTLLAGYPVALNRGFSVLVVECIPPTDPVGQVSRRVWPTIIENLSSQVPTSTFVYVDAPTSGALRAAVSTHEPDILVISAHGFSQRDANAAGIMIGETPSLGIGLGPLPPLVVLSACHVAPRGTGQVTIADLLLREGAMTVLGTLVPVDVRRNALLTQRLLYAIGSRVDRGTPLGDTIREVWHWIQWSNAVLDIAGATPRFLDWFMTRPAGQSRSPQETFRLERGHFERVRPGHVYGDSEELLIEIADALGAGDRVRSWIRGTGYLPESAMYCLVGEPERILLGQ
jgi:hypothetical protein